MSKCRTCGAPVRWCKTEANRWIPIDVDPVGDGNVIIVDDSDVPVVRVLTRIELLAACGARFVSHFATCPDAAEHRR